MGELIVVGDKILVEPIDGEQQTESGLILPATAAERDKVRIGRAIKVGPGYLIPNSDYSEDWDDNKKNLRYLPLQAEEGDTVYYLANQVTNITWKGKNLCVVPNSAILFLVRPDHTDMLDNFDSLLDN